eukprot:scaffold1411_cov252-Pinguiococcus_pyrenoidosus.AAC.16
MDEPRHLPRLMAHTAAFLLRGPRPSVRPCGHVLQGLVQEAIAPKVAARPLPMKTPVLHANPAELVPAAPVGARHVIAALVLLNGGLASWALLRVGQEPHLVRDVLAACGADAVQSALFLKLLSFPFNPGRPVNDLPARQREMRFQAAPEAEGSRASARDIDRRSRGLGRSLVLSASSIILRVRFAHRLRLASELARPPDAGVHVVACVKRQALDATRGRAGRPVCLCLVFVGQVDAHRCTASRPRAVANVLCSERKVIRHLTTPFQLVLLAQHRLDGLIRHKHLTLVHWAADARSKCPRPEGRRDVALPAAAAELVPASDGKALVGDRSPAVLLSVDAPSWLRPSRSRLGRLLDVHRIFGSAGLKGFKADRTGEGLCPGRVIRLARVRGHSKVHPGTVAQVQGHALLEPRVLHSGDVPAVACEERPRVFSAEAQALRRLRLAPRSLTQ